jgi:hypothetical protein
MAYLDGNSDRIAQWEDLQPEEMTAAARAMLEAGKYLTKVNGLWHKLEAQDRTRLRIGLSCSSEIPCKKTSDYVTGLQNSP